MTDRNEALAKEILRRWPRSRADELHIDVSKNTPAPLFQWLVAALLFSARIGADQAQKAAAALKEAGWTTPEKLADTTWEQRVKVLNTHGYARYDEKTSRFLGEDMALLRDRWKGDLRNLREEAGRDPEKERDLLKLFKGVGEVGADIFMREAQLAWEELFPFADKRALQAAEKLGLPADPEKLSALVSRRDYPRLLDALVRLDLENELEQVRDAV